MSNILHITASIRGDESVSRDLSNRIVASLAAKSDVSVVERDLSTNDLPFIDGPRFAANLADPAERTPEQQEIAAIADALIAELQSADTIVMGIPIYNFSVPASVKAWADLVARAGTTFEYTAEGPRGKLTGKKVYLAVASGGTPVGSDYDHMTPWLKFFLGFLGITDVELVVADGIMGEGGEKKIAEAKRKADEMAA